MNYYVCYNQCNNLYYSKIYGWVADVELADHYTAYEARKMQPTEGGCWIKISEIVKGKS